MCAALLAGLLALPLWLVATPVEDLRVEGEHPRLLLTQRRLRLLKREKDRNSFRWQQFSALVRGKVQLPEPGFALALYYQVAGEEEQGRAAVGWALTPSARDLRQLALVFDWCQPLLDSQQRAALAAKLKTALERPTQSGTLPQMRDQVFAAIAASGHLDRLPEARLNEIVNRWWAQEAAPELESGRLRFPRSEIYALYEFLHAVRDNLNADLRESAQSYFKDLPAYQLLTYRPAPYDAGENEFHIPVTDKPGEPDLTRAALSRAAEFAMVAFDTNALESQFLQGWLIRDRFLMRGPFGAPYEFLWANPYQPGLSVYHMPLYLRDAKAGALLVRSSWEENSRWFGLDKGTMLVLESGRLQTIDPLRAGALDFGDCLILFPSQHRGVTVSGGETKGKTIFWVGLQPHHKYEVRVAAGASRIEAADAGGVIVTAIPPRAEQTVAVSPVPAENTQP